MAGTTVRPDTTPDQLLHMVFSSGRPFILMQVRTTITMVDRQHVLMALPWPAATAFQPCAPTVA